MQTLNEDKFEDQKVSIENIIKDFNKAMNGDNDSVIEYVRYTDAYVVADFADIFIEFRGVSSRDFRYHILTDLIEKETNRLITKLKQYYFNTEVYFDIIDTKDNKGNIFPHSMTIVNITIQA
ncbi:MAG: hypothetical protein JHC33_03400 [Ignisphaera sp.]|nr:hypothetical protein [Ignisphaera sp.]